MLQVTEMYVPPAVTVSPGTVKSVVFTDKGLERHVDIIELLHVGLDIATSQSVAFIVCRIVGSFGEISKGSWVKKKKRFLCFCGWTRVWATWAWV